MTPSRRSFLTGLASVLAAPAIVRASSLMPVRGIVMDWAPPKAYYFQNRVWWIVGPQMLAYSDRMPDVQSVDDSTVIFEGRPISFDTLSK